MAKQLVYTSAPKGLWPGTSGYCTVLSTEGIARATAEYLERLSAYRIADDDGGTKLAPTPQNYDRLVTLNPPNLVHAKYQFRGQSSSVLLKTCLAEFDYSQRLRKLSHFLVLDPSEKIDAGPAWLASQPNMFIGTWGGTPKMLQEDKPLPNGLLQAGPCRAWQQLAGDAGWAGELIRPIVSGEQHPIYVVYDPQISAVPLLLEATALLPPELRWDATFATNYSTLPQGIQCQWRFVPSGSPEHQRALGIADAKVIDLTAALGSPSNTTEVEAARAGQMVAARPAPTPTPAPAFPAPVVPAAEVAEPDVIDFDADDPFQIQDEEAEEAPIFIGDPQAEAAEQLRLNRRSTVAPEADPVFVDDEPQFAAGEQSGQAVAEPQEEVPRSFREIPGRVTAPVEEAPVTPPPAPPKSGSGFSFPLRIVGSILFVLLLLFGGALALFAVNHLKNRPGNDPTPSPVVIKPLRQQFEITGDEPGRLMFKEPLAGNDALIGYVHGDMQQEPVKHPLQLEVCTMQFLSDGSFSCTLDKMKYQELGGKTRTIHLSLTLANNQQIPIQFLVRGRDQVPFADGAEFNLANGEKSLEFNLNEYYGHPGRAKPKFLRFTDLDKNELENLKTTFGQLEDLGKGKFRYTLTSESIKELRAKKFSHEFLKDEFGYETDATSNSYGTIKIKAIPQDDRPQLDSISGKTWDPDEPFEFGIDEFKMRDPDTQDNPEIQLVKNGKGKHGSFRLAGNKCVYVPNARRDVYSQLKDECQVVAVADGKNSEPKRIQITIKPRVNIGQEFDRFFNTAGSSFEVEIPGKMGKPRKLRFQVFDLATLAVDGTEQLGKVHKDLAPMIEFSLVPATAKTRRVKIDVGDQRWTWKLNDNNQDLFEISINDGNQIVLTKVQDVPPEILLGYQLRAGLKSENNERRFQLFTPAQVHEQMTLAELVNDGIRIPLLEHAAAVHQGKLRMEPQQVSPEKPEKWGKNDPLPYLELDADRHQLLLKYDDNLLNKEVETFTKTWLETTIFALEAIEKKSGPQFSLMKRLKRLSQHRENIGYTVRPTIVAVGEREWHVIVVWPGLL